MPLLTIRKADFDQLVFPAVDATGGARTFRQLRAAGPLLAKLEDLGQPPAVPTDPETGEPLPYHGPRLVMATDEAQLELTAEEAQLLHGRLQRALRGHTVERLRAAQDLVDALDDAVQEEQDKARLAAMDQAIQERRAEARRLDQEVRRLRAELHNVTKQLEESL